MKRNIRNILAASAAAGLLLTGCGQQPTGPAAGTSMEDAQVSLCDYVGIEVQASSTAVTEEDVDSSLDSLLEYQSFNAMSDRTVAEDGDSVFATVEVTDMDGNMVDDGSGSYGIVDIGSGGTYPEVERGIIGMEVGEEKEVAIRLSDPYEYNVALSGKMLKAKITLNGIRSNEMLHRSTLTDEQAERIFGKESVEDLRAYVREQLEANKEDLKRSSAYDQISQYLLDNCTVDPFPDAELAARTEEQISDVKQLCTEYYGMSFDEYLEGNSMTEEEFRASVEGQHRNTILLELIYTAIADKEGIQYGEDEYQAYIGQVVSDAGYESVDMLYDEYGEDYIRMAYRVEKVVDWLIERADFVTESAAEPTPEPTPEPTRDVPLDEEDMEPGAEPSSEEGMDSGSDEIDEPSAEESAESSSESSSEEGAEPSSEEGTGSGDSKNAR